MENRSSGFMSGLSAFGRGLFSGAVSGALMAGIFSGLAIAFGMTPAGWIGGAVLSLSAGVFAGLMNVYRDYTHRNQAASGQMREGHVAAASPGMVPVLVPAVAQDRSQTPEQEAPTRNWAASLDRKPGHDRMKEIIADRSLNDKTRAAAILQEREARAATPAEAAR